MEENEAGRSVPPARPSGRAAAQKKQYVSKEKILMHWYGFLKILIPRLQKLPRDQKFFIGDRIQSISLLVLELLIEVFISSKMYKWSGYLLYKMKANEALI